MSNTTKNVPGEDPTSPQEFRTSDDITLRPVPHLNVNHDCHCSHWDYPYYIAESALELKRQANEAYTQSNFCASFAIYTQILIRFIDAPLSFIRIVRCNRGACCIALQRYEEGIKDFQWVLQCVPEGGQSDDTESNSILTKTHFRLARCLFEVKRYGDALRELDKYRCAKESSECIEAEAKLRTKILQAIAERDEIDKMAIRILGQGTQESSSSQGPNSNSDRPLRYEVKVFESEPTIIITDHIPNALCSNPPPKIASRTFSVQLLKKHHGFLMDQKQWKCWNCPSRAVSLIHTPALYFHLPEPKVVDYAQPICEDGGACDFAARKMMEETMLLTATLGKDAGKVKEGHTVNASD